MIDWESDPWNTGLTKAIHFPSTFFAKLFFELQVEKIYSLAFYRVTSNE